ncbi:MAG: hypothetical protein COX79_05625 [Candidatus Levybacteria bacterium CG_4_10_14_0_2_um_filter_36_16]|nr:MAG: hypothetical protein AUK12_01365 [Candidatus Levybacteria bacterium CG2_30_37_29]PIR78734.1 MAG: hypothetical protein COU26_04835 [Candidatus Levybacteria bacterium CG10_big_fil_rev_8_21_14_0_10_36_30]PIZ96149.1 MAG: hypothetical protein COX79_05625 [Candidatus Levybacteria bacterium CG_4_10_14_0_2_um_filter_36_16]
MLGKLKNLFFGIREDFISVKYKFLSFYYFSSLRDKIIFSSAIVCIFLITVFTSTSKAEFYVSAARITAVIIITFFIFVLSETLWSAVKKTWYYKVHVKNRRSISVYLKNIHQVKFEGPEADHPEGAIYIISSSNSSGYGDNIVRNGLEIVILLSILVDIFPYSFDINFILICITFIYVMIYDRQSVDQVFSDLVVLILCIDKLYKENPENCRKIIMENDILSMQELRTIYRAVKRSNEKLKSKI